MVLRPTRSFASTAVVHLRLKRIFPDSDDHLELLFRLKVLVFVHCTCILKAQNALHVDSVTVEISF